MPTNFISPGIIERPNRQAGILAPQVLVQRLYWLVLALWLMLKARQLVRTRRFA